MVSTIDLWLPILLSGVFVFVASSVIHMATPMHKNDLRKLPDETAVMDTLRQDQLKPGGYAFPRPESMRDFNSPEVQAKFERGPVGYLAILPSGPPAMGKSLLLWFLYTIVVSVFVAYISGIALQAGSEGKEVFRVSSSVALLAYGIAQIPDAIWKGYLWSVTLKHALDGVIYALITAATFVWLWP